MLEVTSPGTIPPSIDLNDLSTGQSEIRNKTIAPIFKELKLIEQWGTGFQKLFDSLKEYPNLEVRFNQPALSFQVQLIKNNVDSDTFISQKEHKVKLDKNLKSEATPQATPQVVLNFVESSPQIIKILEFCLVPKLRNEIQLLIGLTDRKYFSKKYINPLIILNLIEMTMPEKPQSPKQKYKTTLLGEQIIGKFNVL